MKGATMKPYVIFLLIAAFIACGCHGNNEKKPDNVKPPQPQAGPAAEGAVPADEYEVLSALLETFAGGDIKMLVIADHTVTYGAGDDSAAVASRLDIPAALVEDYSAKNKDEAPLENRFTFSVDYVLLSDEDFERIFSAPEHGGWDMFYRKFPNSAGHIQISRPGFNKDKTLALVYVGNQRHWLAGVGEYVVLEKINGAWTIRKRDMVWIS
jgi:hypothetical protein